MITLYGTARSRAARSLVALEEFGLAYEHVPLFAGGATSADRERLAALNPNGHIPVLEDEGQVVFESMAINLYLGDRYGGPLWPAGPTARALLYQWSAWVLTEVDRPDWNAARRSGDEERVRDAVDATLAALAILDRALADRAYLLGDHFSLADVNVAASMSQPNEQGKIGWQRIVPAEHGLDALADWLGRCVSRPSWRRVGELP